MVRTDTKDSECSYASFVNFTESLKQHEKPSFHDSVENHIRGLSAVGQSRDSYSALLVPTILGKLLAEIKRNLARNHPAFEWSIDELREAILKKIKVLKLVSTSLLTR